MKPADQRPAVLHLVNSFGEGGTERQAVQLVNALNTTGAWAISVASLDPRGPVRDALLDDLRHDARSYPLAAFARWDTLGQVRRFAGYLRRNRVSILHTHGFYANVFGMAAAAAAGVPVRIAGKRESMQLRRQGHARLERLAFSVATRLIANCRAVKEEMIACGVAADRIDVIHNALHPHRVHDVVQPPDGPRRVVMLANFHHHAKDHAMVLRAARRVVARMPDVGFTLAGDGPLRLGVQAHARELGLEPHTTFPGLCSDVAALLADADVCVLGSRHEGFPNVILEYMGAGRPVVATDAGGVREAVVDGVTGWLVPPGDDAAMADALLRVLDDAPRARAMGAAGRARALQEFTVERQLERVGALYTSELKRHSTMRR